jgi:hypothetical protein
MQGLHPSRATFFYPGPEIPFPVRDFGIVMLEGAPLWLLTTPSYAPQEIPDSAATIPNSKQTPDQLCDAPQRPIVLGMTMSTGPLQKSLLQLSHLSQRQTTRTIGRP